MMIADTCVLSHLVLHHNETWLLETVDDHLQDLCTSMPCHPFLQQDQINTLQWFQPFHTQEEGCKTSDNCTPLSLPSHAE
jgi:hypothetical protein